MPGTFSIAPQHTSLFPAFYWIKNHKTCYLEPERDHQEKSCWAIMILQSPFAPPLPKPSRSPGKLHPNKDNACVNHVVHIPPACNYILDHGNGKQIPTRDSKGYTLICAKMGHPRLCLRQIPLTTVTPF